jgi:hypothetical protein
MLKLMPILEHMNACEESKYWLRKRKYATFAEAWDACSAWWKDWVVAVLAEDGCVGACNLWGIVRPWNTDLFLAVYRNERHNVERWLVEYAHKHGCAVEVAS